MTATLQVQPEEPESALLWWRRVEEHSGHSLLGFPPAHGGFKVSGVGSREVGLEQRGDSTCEQVQTPSGANIRATGSFHFCFFVGAGLGQCTPSVHTWTVERRTWKQFVIRQTTRANGTEISTCS